MKKIIILAIAVCMLFTLAACGKKTPEADVSFDEEALQEDAKSVSDALISGDYQAIRKKFDTTMKLSLSAKALEDGWVQTVGEIGDYVERYSVEGAVDSGYYVVIVMEQFESSGVRVRVVYDTSGKIAGLQCALASLDEPVMVEGIEEEKVTVTADERYPLDGSLTLPIGVDKPPVVILVQGSGASDMNESVNANRPFFDIAQGLAKQGIATLRFNKRYFTYPEACTELGAELTVRDEVLDDVYAAIKMMQNDDRVDESRIYVLGHSLGGMLTPVIAAENQTLAGVISMAGSIRPLWEICYDQDQEVIAGLDVNTLSATDKEILDSQVKQIESDIAVLRGDFADIPDDTTLLGISAGYWKSLKEVDGKNYIDEITMPMLILQGSADFQVYPDKDYPLWQDTLAERDNVTFHLYDGLNHMMMPTQGKRDITEYYVAGNVDEQVISDIAKFVNQK